MTRTFRFQLAARAAGAMGAGLALVGLIGHSAIRVNLDRQISSTLLNVASIQAASVTDAPSGEMTFQEWQLTPQEAELVLDLNRYTQVWTAEGASLLRTRLLTEDLPLDEVALRQAASGALVWEEQSFQGAPIRSLYYPLGQMGAAHTPHILQVAAPLDARNQLLREVALFLIAVVGVGALCGFAGGWWLARRAMLPVQAVIAQAASIRPGSRHRIQASVRTREYQKLIEVLNGMLSRLQGAFDAQRQFTADASHELRSPLTALRGELELVRRRDRSAVEYRAAIDSALEEVERLGRLSENLLTLARSDSGAIVPQLRRADMAELAADTLQRLKKSAERRRVRLCLEASSKVMGYVDPQMIERVMWNVIDNAIKFTPLGGEVRVRLTNEAGFARLEVADQGPGIPDKQLPHVFERFYRGDDSRTPDGTESGTGLGLAIAAALVDLHGGDITAANQEARPGAVIRISIPMLREAQSYAGVPPARAPGLETAGKPLAETN